MKAKSVLQGAGVATLYILPIAGRFLDPRLNELYHHPHPISSIPLAMLAMTLLVWLVSSIAFFAVERLRERWRNLATIAIAVFFVGLLIRILMFLRQPTFTWVLALRVLYCLLILVPIVLAVSLRAWRGFFARCTVAIGLMYTIAGFGLLVILPRLASYGFRGGPREQTSFHRDGLPVRHANSRIVWILMDELSYDQTFDHRQPELSLPNFDAFARQSTSFSNMQPSGFRTEIVIPGLLLGEPVRELNTPFHGRVSVRSVSGGAWQPLDQHSTIFAEAWKLGWNPGIVGWYNPYCRLLPDVLARCWWEFSDDPPAVVVPISYDKSVAENMLALMPIRADVEYIFRHRLDNSSHRRDYEDVMKHAEELLRDRRIRFAFLHLPVPHPPGIYDRSTHQISSHGDYLDNLVLADDTLGALMKVLGSTEDDQQTTVIVSSDHSWRTSLWKPEPTWSDEEERVTNGGKFDTRPVLMVHLPGEDAGQVIAKPVSALIVHRIIEGLLRDQIHVAGDIDELLDWQPQGAHDLQNGN
ncbi:MAG TPA: sulfatase-like hydrolase/transferase [Terracidiphilus sp.]